MNSIYNFTIPVDLHQETVSDVSEEEQIEDGVPQTVSEIQHVSGEGASRDQVCDIWASW